MRKFTLGFFLAMLCQFALAGPSLKDVLARAQAGDVKAQFQAATMYSAGQSVAQDYGQGFYWYSKAAEQGHAESQYNLGLMYQAGQGVVQDSEKAVEWWTKSATQGFPRAKQMLENHQKNKSRK